jgi:predicted MFS family arabinose efflux permease
MGASAISGLILGILYDKKGAWVLIGSLATSALFAPLAFLGGAYSAFIGILLWGIGMGVQQSIVKAVIANMIPTQQRGMAYGTFNMVFGVAWFLGSALMGILYDHSIMAIVLFSVTIQLISLPLFYKSMRTMLISK